MSDDIYQTQLLRLAASALGTGRLPQPDATVTLDNPLCGDRITLDLALDDGRVAAVGHEVRACVLCQASASLIGAHAPGATAPELQAVTEKIAALLRREEEGGLPWPELEAFRPVIRHKSRHACVLLPFRALEQALADAAMPAPEGQAPVRGQP